MSEQLDVGAQVTAIVVELKLLREICASQKTEMEQLHVKNDMFTNENQHLLGQREGYEKRLAENDEKMLSLSVQVEQREAECDSYTKNLGQLRQENAELKARVESDIQYIWAIETELTRRNAQITKLITILRRKIATSRVAQTALKAAYRILPDLKRKATLAKVLEIAKQVPNKDGIRLEFANSLREADIAVGRWDQKSAQKPAQIRGKETVDNMDIDDNAESAQTSTVA
ncbi:hypothetical protein SNK04_004698 [Fusarium graminearum]